MEKRKKKKCDFCLRKAEAGTTGVTGDTLQIDMGGAVFYVIPLPNGKIDVDLNAESLVQGNYLSCRWTGEKWII